MCRRLTLVIHSLAMGGAERIVAAMANHWSARGDAVTLVTLDTAATDTYPLSAAVRRVGLGLMRESRTILDAAWRNVGRIRRLRRAIRDSSPDIVISATDKTNVLTLLACRPLSVPVVVAEHTDPRRHEIGRAWSLLRRRVYPRCAALVVLTESIAEYARRLAGDRPVRVIPNAVDAGSLGCKAEGGASREGRAPRIIGMGRLTPVKGFDTLIRAFSRLAPRHPAWTLEILGEGPQRAELEKLVAESRLTEWVRLPGWVAEPGAVLRGSRIFVLSSRYEGFPNALLEAMACGLAVVAFDCESGPAEIIRDGVDGLLVPAGNVEALASAVDRLLQDPAEEQRYADRAVEVLRRFSAERFFERWEAVLHEAMRR